MWVVLNMTIGLIYTLKNYQVLIKKHPSRWVMDVGGVVGCGWGLNPYSIFPNQCKFGGFAVLF